MLGGGPVQRLHSERAAESVAMRGKCPSRNDEAHMRRSLALLVTFGAAGCGQSPPPATSTAAPAQLYREYKTEGGVEILGQKAKFQRTVHEPVENKSP
jgi:hypothetical protein